MQTKKQKRGKWAVRLVVTAGLLAALWPLMADRAHALLGGLFRGLIGLVGGLALVIGGGVIDYSKLAQNKLLNKLHEQVSEQMTKIKNVEEEVRERLARLTIEHRQKQNFAEAQQRRNFQLPPRPKATEQLLQMQAHASDFYGLSPVELSQDLPERGEVACQMIPQAQAALEEVQQQISREGFTLDELDHLLALAESEADVRTLSAAQQLRLAQGLYMARVLRLTQTRLMTLQYLCQRHYMEQEQQIKRKWFGQQ